MIDSPVTAKFDFIKSALFRVVHADGVFGGMTPRGGILLNFYNERFPIPTSVLHQITSSGEIGDEIRSEREGRKGIVREVEIGVQLDLAVAKAFVAWLQQKINDAEQHKSSTTILSDDVRETV